MKEHHIDATDKVFGRLASEVAVLLRGKDEAAWIHTVLPTNKAVISNVAKIKFTGHKMEQRTYYHYSGYPGGMRARTLETEWAKAPAKVFRSSVYRMLPKNRQRDQIIKNLIFN